MLPAGHGDCVWIEYGEASALHRMLIDGGTDGTYMTLRARIESLPPGDRHFELLILTHVDADHIGGVLKLIADESLAVSFTDVWFNGFRHLPESDAEEFGPLQGEKLTSYLISRRLGWNAAFHGKAAAVPHDGPLPVIPLKGGLELTVLSPDPEKLRELRPVWVRECRNAGLDPTIARAMPKELPPGIESMGTPDVGALASSDFTEDDAEANGSSIAVLAAFSGRRLLLAGDAHPSALESGIDRLVGAGQQLALDAFKLPHHGSKANVNRRLLERVACERYLFSTNGAHFRHPDQEAVARVIKFGRSGGRRPTLFFNYRTPHNAPWDQGTLARRYDFQVVFPPQGTEGLALAF